MHLIQARVHLPLSEWQSSEIQITNAGVDMGEGESYILLMGLWTSAASVEILKKLEPDLPCDPGVPFLGIYPPNSVFAVEIFAHLCSLPLRSQQLGNTINLDIHQLISDEWNHACKGILLSCKQKRYTEIWGKWMDLEDLNWMRSLRPRKTNSTCSFPYEAILFRVFNLGYMRKIGN